MFGSNFFGFFNRSYLFSLLKKLRCWVPVTKASESGEIDSAEALKSEEVSAQDIEVVQPKIPLTLFEAFAGVGGTRLGAEQAGFKVLASSEVDKHCLVTYQDNFGDAPLGDITKINAEDLPDFSVLTASTPCQSFSTQGKQKGLKDNRGQLIHDVLRIVDSKKPKVVFIENVKGMATTNNGQGLKFVLKELKQRGYFSHWKVLKASEYGVPQGRERLFIVAFAENVPFTFPKPTVLPAASGEILENFAHENYYLTQSEVDTQVEAKIRYDSKGHNFGFQILDPQKPSSTILRSESSLKKNLVAVPLDKKAPASRGIYESKDSNGKTKKVHLRKLTPRECARLQGFPDSYKLTSSASQTYKQMGNSVPVPVIRELFKEILVSLTLWDSGMRVNLSPAKTVNPVPPNKNLAKPKKTVTPSKPSENRKAQRKSKTRKAVRNSAKPRLKPVYGMSRIQTVSESIPPVFPKATVETDQSIIDGLKKWHLKDEFNHFMTPKWLVDFVKFVYPIELDAASSPEANAINGFERIFTENDDAQKQSWKVQDGKGVFINPPYVGGYGLMGWAKKVVAEYEQNRQPIFILVPSRTTESQWFQLYFQKATHVVFLKKRLKHNDLFTKKPADFPSALIVFGGDQLRERIAYLSELGECVETSAYRNKKEASQKSKISVLSRTEIHKQQRAVA